MTKTTHTEVAYYIDDSSGKLPIKDILSSKPQSSVIDLLSLRFESWFDTYTADGWEYHKNKLTGFISSSQYMHIDSNTGKPTATSSLRHETTFYFKDPREAMLFKLTWC